MSVVMPRHHFNTAIRFLWRANRHEVEQVRNATYRKLKQLGVDRDTGKASTRMPNGSDHFDVRSFVNWADKIQADDESAIEQLVAIDATAVKRMG